MLACQSVVLLRNVVEVGSSIDEEILEYLGRNANLRIFDALEVGRHSICRILSFCFNFNSATTC